MIFERLPQWRLRGFLFKSKRLQWSRLILLTNKRPKHPKCIFICLRSLSRWSYTFLVGVFESSCFLWGLGEVDFSTEWVERREVLVVWRSICSLLPSMLVLGVLLIGIGDLLLWLILEFNLYSTNKINRLPGPQGNNNQLTLPNQSVPKNILKKLMNSINPLMNIKTALYEGKSWKSRKERKWKYLNQNRPQTHSHEVVDKWDCSCLRK
jgi:hypothetical protein